MTTVPMTTFLSIQTWFSYDSSPSIHTHALKLLKDLNLHSRTNIVVFHLQPAPDFSELSKLQVSVRCRPTSQRTPPEYDIDIDLKTLQISEAASDHTPEPGNIFSVEATGAAMELRKYANNLLKRTQKFRDRLIQLGVIADSSPFLQVDLLTCPLCRKLLRTCRDCDAVVACPRGCPASVATEGQWCDIRSIFSCHQCLDTKGIGAALVQCPTCQLWRDPPDLEWCFGHVTLSSEELAGLPESDHESIKRSHPRKPGPCTFCVEAGIASSWQSCSGDLAVCPSLIGLPRRLHIPGSFCPDCVADIRGRGCVCGFTWTCNVCTDGAGGFACPRFTTCPRCRRTYCLQYNGCDYCEICRTCKKPRLCNDCIEEEPILGEDQTSAVTFVERCEKCHGPICDDCSPRTLKCSSCNNRICGVCTLQSQHSSSNTTVCTSCYVPPIEDPPYMDSRPPSPRSAGEQDYSNKDNGVSMED